VQQRCLFKFVVTAFLIFILVMKSVSQAQKYVQLNGRVRFCHGYCLNPLLFPDLFPHLPAGLKGNPIRSDMSYYVPQPYSLVRQLHIEINFFSNSFHHQKNSVLAGRLSTGDPQIYIYEKSADQGLD